MKEGKSKMLRIDAFEKVRVMSVDETARTNDEGEVKTNAEFPGCRGYGVRVRYPDRVRHFEDGDEVDYAERRVTVWSPTRPSVAEGSYARLIGVRVGAYSQSGNRADLYIWAEGLEDVETTTSSLDSLMGGDTDD